MTVEVYPIRKDLTDTNYHFQTLAFCGGCKQPIEVWLTPARFVITFNPIKDDDSEAVPHLKTCVCYVR